MYPKSKPPPFYHKAINPDIKSHTGLVWCGFTVQPALTGLYMLIILTPCPLLRENRLILAKIPKQA